MHIILTNYKYIYIHTTVHIFVFTLLNVKCCLSPCTMQRAEACFLYAICRNRDRRFPDARARGVYEKEGNAQVDCTSKRQVVWRNE